MRYYRTTGLALTQMQELVLRVSKALDKPWSKAAGRPKSLRLCSAVEAACIYLRQNATQEFIGDMREVSQPTISRYAANLIPVVKAVLEEFVPSAQDAIEMVSGRVCLVDGTITPCWSYQDHDELRSRKKGTTGFSAQVVSFLDGYPVYVSGPLAGSVHDAAAYEETPVKKIVEASGGGIADKGYQGTGMITPRKKPKGGELSKKDKESNASISALRAPVERTISHLKSWRILHADYRRPYSTYRDAYDAARALFFFSLTWGLNNTQTAQIAESALV